ncbi:MAG: FAD-dependent oxidoreductase, partial [Aliidongia sp.]
VDPHGVVRGLAERLSADGGKFAWREVTGFDIVENTVRAIQSGECYWAIDHVVLAPGAEAAGLTGQLGAVVPLTRERGYHLMLQPAALDLTVPVTFAERGFVMTPMNAGIRLAGTVELGAGAAPDWRRAEILARHARRLFGRPDLAAASRWHGDRPTLPDYLPMIGPSPRASNAVLALGHQHLGLTLAAITGALVADLIAGRPPAVPLAPFRTDRFGIIKTGRVEPFTLPAEG